MSISFIQSGTNNTLGGTGNPLSVPLGANVGNGRRLLIVSTFWAHPAGTATIADISSVTDTLGTVFTNAAVANASPTTATWGMATYYGVAPLIGGPDTITIAYSGPWTLVRMAVNEYTGHNILLPFDTSSTANGTSTALNSGVATTSFDNELLFGFALSEGSAIFTAGVNESFVIRDQFDGNSDGFCATEDAIKAVAGSTSAQFTNASSGPWICQLTTFKMAVPGGSEDDPMSMLPGYMTDPSIVSVW